MSLLKRLRPLRRNVTSAIHRTQRYASVLSTKDNLLQIFDPESPTFLAPYEKVNNELAFILEQLDAMIERSWPVSSLMIDRMVDSCTSYEELGFNEYYFYKYRHNASGTYMRPWTVSNLIQRCCTVDQEIYSEKLLELLFKMLETRNQYGLFPHASAYHYLIDHLMGADESIREEYLVRAARNAFLAERLDTPYTALLCARIAGTYLLTHPVESIEDKILLRDLGGILMVAGLTLDSPRTQEAGVHILNLLEKQFLEDNEFRKMYMAPYAPLSSLPEFLDLEKPSEEQIKTSVDAAMGDPLISGTDEIETKIIQHSQAQDLKDFQHWKHLKSHLSTREAKIVDTRTNKYYFAKMQQALQTEARVSAITQRGLWQLATDDERSAAGRAEGLLSDSEKVFTEYSDTSLRHTEISAFAIHDLDLEQKISNKVREFKSSDGNVEVFTNFTFDAQSTTHRYIGNRALCMAHYALRNLDNTSLKKVLERSDVKPGIYNFD